MEWYGHKFYMHTGKFRAGTHGSYHAEMLCLICNTIDRVDFHVIKYYSRCFNFIK